MKLALWRHNYNQNAPKLEKHPLKYYDLTIVLSGALNYRINGKRVIVRDNEAICIQPNSFRERNASTEPINYISFNFSTETPLELPLHTPPIINREIKALIACIDAISDNYHSNMKEQVSHLLSCLILNLQSTLKNENEPITIIKIKQYVHLHLSEKITLEKIGKELYFNPIYCETLFKQKTGMPIISYVVQRRIKEAKRLIQEGISLNSIPELIGFESYSYFARTFKKHTGLTPLQYRKFLSLPTPANK